jgi:hypothetical protein
MGHCFHGIIAGMDKGRAQEKVFRGIATYRQLGRQQQPRAIGISGLGCGDDLLGITLQVTHNEIELRNAQFESHETGIFR